MKDLGALGLGALVCVPCLLAVAGVSLAASGGALLALASDPVAQATAVLVVIAGLATARRYARRRRACPQCEVERPEGNAVTAVRHEAHL